MADHRYSVNYAELVRSPAARRYLSSVGLPAKHVLFGASESHGHGVENAGGRDLLKVGSGGDGADAYCIDCESGEVLYLSSGDRSLSFVNSSPQKFSEFLISFERETARSAGGDDPAVLEGLAALLERSFEEIDAPALLDDLGFWRSILFDVAIGDYADGGE